MLGQNIPIDIEKIDYEYLRSFLFLHSAGFKKLINTIRKKYKLDSVNSKEIAKYLFLAEGLIKQDSEALMRCPPDLMESIAIIEEPISKKRDRLKIYQQLGLEIDSLKYKLQLNKFFLQNCIADPPITKEISHYLAHTLPVFFDPEKQEGFFIRVDSNTKIDTVTESWRYIKNQLKFFEKSCDRPPQKSSVTMRYHEPAREDIEKYILIEEKLKKELTQENKNTNKMLKNAIKSVNFMLIKDLNISNEYTSTRKFYIDFLNKFQIPKIDYFFEYK